MVAAPVPDILDALGEGDATLDELAARLDVGGEQAVLSERLDELVATGLVERP